MCYVFDVVLLSCVFFFFFLYFFFSIRRRHFFFQAEDGIRDFCLSRGLGDVYKRQRLDRARKFATIRQMLGLDLSDWPLDRPISAADLPPPVANPGSRTHTDLLRRLIERETLRLDQLLLRPEVVSAAHWQVIGTVDDAVEQIVDWAAAGAMDGFIAAPGGSVGSLRLFLEQVVPRLVEKGLFRERYSATTFAGHLAEE